MQNSLAKKANKTFIERALEQILGDKDITRSYHSQLKKACESALGKFSCILSKQKCHNKNTFFINDYPRSLLLLITGHHRNRDRIICNIYIVMFLCIFFQIRSFS